MTDTAKKPKVPKIISPRGVLVYPKLHKPDTKFDEDGVYGTRLRVSAELAAPLIADIEKATDAVFAEGKAKMLADPKTKNKAKDLKRTDKPYREAVDEEGNPTGDIEFNFKMRAQYKDKKTGEVKKLKPGLVDAKGKPLPASVSIWGGSEAKVSFQMNPFCLPATGAGVSLRLVGVQVIKLVTKGARDGASMGFGEEDGYEAAAEGDGFGDESGGAPAGDDAAAPAAGAPAAGEEDF